MLSLWVVLLAGFAATGCGAAHSGAAPSKAKFIARADAICREEALSLAGLRLRDRGLAHGVSATELMRKEVAKRQAATARLEGLPRPARGAAAIEQWITARTVASTLALDVAEAPRGEDLAAAADVRAQLARESARERALARDYGLQACAASS